MVKTGFRGERKGILTPTLSQGEGECGDGEAKGTSPYHILRFCGAHTQLSLATSMRGNVVTEKERNDEGRMTNDRGNVEKIFFYTHSRLLIVTYSANVILRGF